MEKTSNHSCQMDDMGWLEVIKNLLDFNQISEDNQVQREKLFK